MNITCNIIKDLLPLYAEDMVSEDSKALVDDHLCSCDSCTKELAELKKAPKVPVEVETSSLKRVEDTIRKRKLLTAVTAVLTLAAVLVTGTIFLMTPVYLTARQAIEGVELRDDGGLAIDYASGIMGYGSTSFGSEDDEFFWCHTTRYDWLRSKLFGPDLSGMTQEELERYVQNNRSEERRVWQLHRADWGALADCPETDRPYEARPHMGCPAFRLYRGIHPAGHRGMPDGDRKYGEL